MKARYVAAMVAALALMTPVQAQWQESFESYADGSILDGQGDWHGWDGHDTPFARVASQFASAGSQCLSVSGGTDSVHEFDAIDSGRWTASTQVYAPSSFAGRVYFLLLNFYQDGGPYQWSVQIAFDGDSGELQCYCGSGTPVTTPLIHDAWAELRCEIDLDGDTIEILYDDVSIGSYAWSTGPFGGGGYGLLQIDAIDLFSDSGNFPHVTELYFDDLRIQAWQGSVGTPFCFGDGTSLNCPCGNIGGSEEGCRNSTGVGAKLTALGSPVVPADDILFQGSQLPALKSAMFFAGTNAINGGQGAVFGDGLRCAGGSIRRLGVKMTSGTGTVNYGPGLGATGGWSAGDTRRFQIWYRDPQGGPCGSGFNLTHGIEIDFIP